MMQVMVKKLHENAVIPKYSLKGDAGLDLTSVSLSYDEYGNAVYGTGLAIQIPYGYVGYIFPRSSISKTDLSLANSVGVIDSNYRGEIILKFKTNMVYLDTDSESEQSFKESDFIDSDSIDVEINDYEVGDRIGQLIIMPLPSIELVEVNGLSDTNRGAGGFGSTGN